MGFGLTTKGFILKRLLNIKEELEADVKSVLGDGINLESNSILGQIIGIFAERLALLWELALAIYNSQYPDTAEDTSLDNCGAIVGVPRLKATKSTTIIRARGEVGVNIPQGSIISVKGNSASRFITSESGTIAEAVNSKQKITFSLVPNSGSWAINFMDEISASLPYNATTTQIKSALEALSNITEISVSGSYSDGFSIEFINDDGLKYQKTFGIISSLFSSSESVDTAVTVIDEGGAYIDIDCIAEESGAKQAPSKTLTEIETPISGWDEAYNLLDAEIGRALESDEDYRTRRELSLQQSRSGTVEAIRNDLQKLENVRDVIVFENDSSATDLLGRPPHSFEAVIDNGDDNVIATAIWNVKPAGIKTFGSIKKSITDSQGISHEICFSRPIGIAIYINIQITPKPNAEVTIAQVKEAILTYGNDLRFGDDVIVYPALMASLNKLEIEDIDIDIGTTSPPSGDNNVVIAPNEKARFDSSNIAVTILT